MKHKYTLVALTLLSSQVAFSALTLTFNITDETFALTGSDTGVPSNFINNGFTNFEILGSGMDFGTVVRFDNDVTFSTSIGTPGGPFGYDTQIGFGSTGNFFGLILNTDTPSEETTLLGSGVFQSYADLSTDAKTFLTTEPFSVIPLNSGSGFDSLTVAYVPEPSAYGTLLGIACLNVVALKRKRS